MCDYEKELDGVLTEFTGKHTTFGALEVRDELRNMDIDDVIYVQVLYETLTWMQHNGLTTKYVARTKLVDDSYVWEFVYAPEMYEVEDKVEDKAEDEVEDAGETEATEEESEETLSEV